MNNGILSITFICALFFLGACSKTENYICTCDGGFSGQGKTENITAESQSDAEGKCAQNNNEPGTADGFYNCRIEK